MSRRRRPVNPPVEPQLPEQTEASRLGVNQFWQGPLPPPAILEQFRQLVPDAPDRIFKAWETESEHRRSFEMTALQGNIRTVRYGQFSAAAFALAAMGVTCFCVWIDQPWVAGIVGGTTVVSVVGAFLYQRLKGE